MNIHTLLDSVTASRRAAELADARPKTPAPFVPESREMETYILPDGREVAVDATASKGASCITYTLKGGKVVVATKKEQR